MYNVSIGGSSNTDYLLTKEVLVVVEDDDAHHLAEEGQFDTGGVQN